LLIIFLWNELLSIAWKVVVEKLLRGHKHTRNDLFILLSEVPRGIWQVIVATGTVCVFHVGGCREVAAVETAGAATVQRWEFFIGDKPHTAAIDACGRRQPMAQIAEADRLVQSGKPLLLHTEFEFKPQETERRALYLDAYAADCQQTM
jgi:hypothetical protein